MAESNGATKNELPPGVLLGAYALMPPDEDEALPEPLPRPPPLRARLHRSTPEPQQSEPRERPAGPLTLRLLPTPPAETAPSPAPGAATPAPAPAASPMDQLETIPLARIETLPGTPEPSARRTPVPSRVFRPMPPPSQAAAVQRGNWQMWVVAAVAMSGVVVGGLVYCFSVWGRDTGQQPAAVVESFFSDLFSGEVRESVLLVHPRHRPEARKVLSNLRRANVQPREVVRKMAQAVGPGRVRFLMGGRRQVGPGKWEIAYSLAAEGARSREGWLPLVAESGRWLLDLNPFAEIDIAPRRVAQPASARLPAKAEETPKLRIDPKTGAVKIVGLSG